MVKMHNTLSLSTYILLLFLNAFMNGYQYIEYNFDSKLSNSDTDRCMKIHIILEYCIRKNYFKIVNPFGFEFLFYIDIYCII